MGCKGSEVRVFSPRLSEKLIIKHFSLFCVLFRDVLVAPQLKEQLLKQVHEQRLGHAQFFLAQKGSHAFALATALAQYLCCEHPTETDSCGTCPSCIQFGKLSHPDLHLYFPNCTTDTVKKDPDSILLAPLFKEFVIKHRYYISLPDWLAELQGENKQASINIRDCNHIIRQNSIRSYMDGYKIYILWTADRLHHAAAPKLLKTLEEPEPESLFVLISDRPDLIPATILSRTHMVHVPCPAKPDIARELKREFPFIAPETAHDIAILSEGDFNKAVKIQGDHAEIKLMLNAFALMMNSAVALAQYKPNNEIHYGEMQKLFGQVVAEGREYQKQFIEFVLRMLRNILMQNADQLSLIRATEAELKIMQPYQNLLNLKQISRMTEECNRALYHIERNGNTAIILTDLYLKFAQYAR